MWTHHEEIKINILFEQNEMIENEIKDRIQDQITSSANSITIRFQGHESPEDKIETVDNFNENILHVICGCKDRQRIGLNGVGIR